MFPLSKLLFALLFLQEPVNMPGVENSVGYLASGTSIEPRTTSESESMIHTSLGNWSAMFHANAAITAQSTVVIVTMSVSTSPFPIVEATAPPNNAPVRLKNAAIAIAWRGVRTRVETTVAIAFAAS